MLACCSVFSFQMQVDCALLREVEKKSQVWKSWKHTHPYLCIPSYVHVLKYCNIPGFIFHFKVMFWNGWEMKIQTEMSSCTDSSQTLVDRQVCNAFVFLSVPPISLGFSSTLNDAPPSGARLSANANRRPTWAAFKCLNLFHKSYLIRTVFLSL